MPIAIPKMTTSKWKEIANDFLTMWNFPNCVGAVDGKHVHMFAPHKSGSVNYNYKGTFSENLMAVVDAKYRFLMVDIGAQGSAHDSTVFRNSQFGKLWYSQSELLCIPEKTPLPGTSAPMPYVLVGDEAFGLRTNIMTPFPGRNLSIKQRVFNYRLSRARRIVENAFGILAQTWRILLKRIHIQPPYTRRIVLACCTLHNILRMSEDDMENATPDDEILLAQPHQESVSNAMDIRNTLSDWFINQGDLRYQYQLI